MGMVAFGRLDSAALIAQQNTPTVERFDRAAMREELLRLAQICQAVDLPAQDAISRTWLPPQTLDESSQPIRQVYYLPQPALTFPAGSRQTQWNERFTAARQRYAETLFAEAREFSAQGDEELAFRRLWQVLREDATHAEANRILGPLVSAVSVRPRLRKANTPQVDFNWPAGSYSRIQTPHFLITTRADARDSIALAEQMESFLALWRQAFFPFWARPGTVRDRFGGAASPWGKTEPMQVVLLANRDEYLQILGASESNVGVSVGYYAPQAKRSFFYPDENLTATLWHELTHQLFAEATRLDVHPEAGTRGGVWLLEGIALYMESLQNQSSYWTIGGMQSHRLQTARYRAVRDGYWLDWQLLTKTGKEQWKQSEDIALRYTQAVGLTHVFMDGLQQPEAREALLRALVAAYANQPHADELLQMLGGDNANAQAAYQAALTLSDDDILRLHANWQNRPPTAPPLRSLVLAGSDLNSEAWRAIGSFQLLHWLDLSFSNARISDLVWLGELKQLQRLSIEGTYVDGNLLPVVAGLRQLQELDLSGCAVDDQALQALRGHPTLETLWLTNTRVTDECLAVLGTLPALKYCNADGTSVTPARLQQVIALRRTDGTQ